MRTNIEIDDAAMEAAMKAGPFKTKKEAVEAGLRLLARKAAYDEILKWEGKLKWEGDDDSDWTTPAVTTGAAGATEALAGREPNTKRRAVAKKSASKARHGRR